MCIPISVCTSFLLFISGDSVMMEKHHIIEESQIGRSGFENRLIFNKGGHIRNHLVALFLICALRDHPDIGQRNVEMVLFVTGTEVLHCCGSLITEFPQLLFLLLTESVYPDG